MAHDDLMLESELIEGLQRKKSGNKGITFLFIIIIFAASAFGAMKYFSPKEEERLEFKESDSLDKLVAASQKNERLEADVTLEQLDMFFMQMGTKTFNINSQGQGGSILTIKVTLEVDREDFVDELRAQVPRILDDFQEYIRTLTPADLEGSAGVFRLKEELLSRINQTVAPVRVKDVLFEEFSVTGGVG